MFLVETGKHLLIDVGFVCLIQDFGGSVFIQTLTSKSFPAGYALCSIFVIYLPNPGGCVVASAIELT